LGHAATNPKISVRVPVLCLFGCLEKASPAAASPSLIDDLHDESPSVLGISSKSVILLIAWSK
jgi:hypothetical protein